MGKQRYYFNIMKCFDDNVITLKTDLAGVSYDDMLELWTFIPYIFEYQLQLRLIIKYVGVTLYNDYMHTY